MYITHARFVSTSLDSRSDPIRFASSYPLVGKQPWLCANVELTIAPLKSLMLRLYFFHAIPTIIFSYSISMIQAIYKILYNNISFNDGI